MSFTVGGPRLALRRISSDSRVENALDLDAPKFNVPKFNVPKFNVLE